MWAFLLTIARTEKQLYAQTLLPENFIPIRIDLTIQGYRPDPPLPTPHNAREYGIDENLPAYKQPEMTPSYRLKDSITWNLHETLYTPEMYARTFVDDMDFAQDRKMMIIQEIAGQIRQQLEEYAGVAMHPLFHSTNTAANGLSSLSVQPGASRDQSSTPAPTSNFAPTPSAGPNGTGGASTPIPAGADGSNISATATRLPADDVHNPDDTYRCILNLNINIKNRLYSDKFEWSLLHPPGYAEMFAKQTCADMGLSGEWVSAMSHAIHEAVLRLKKEACENGGLVGYGEIDNDAAEGAEAGWRYDPENLCDDWEPKVETLSKEEIEKREGDRERQIRRLRRETARFSSTSNMQGGIPAGSEYYLLEQAEERMGRGERSKKKRRFRSLSPQARDSPETTGGYGGQGGGLTDWYVAKSLQRDLFGLLTYFNQGTPKLALHSLQVVWPSGLGSSRWTTRIKGEFLHSLYISLLCHAAIKRHQLTT